MPSHAVNAVKEPEERKKTSNNYFSLALKRKTILHLRTKTERARKTNNGDLLSYSFRFVSISVFAYERRGKTVKLLEMNDAIKISTWQIFDLFFFFFRFASCLQYVPVYIRLGDTPLNDINPELAVAFHEVAVNGRQLKSNDEVSHKSMSQKTKQIRQMPETKTRPPQLILITWNSFLFSSFLFAVCERTTRHKSATIGEKNRHRSEHRTCWTATGWT